jgi:hypothetical protein
MVLFAMVAAWLMLVGGLFHRLRRRHLSTYRALGSPGLRNNSLPNVRRFLKFLYGAEWRQLGDPAVEKACRFLRVHLVLCLVLFAGMVVIVASGALSRP